MKILVACDSFKDALDAKNVCKSLAAGLRAGFPEVAIEEVPVADGGEGTAEILTESAGGQFVRKRVEDPLGRPVETKYGMSADRKTAFIDLASASGLELLSPAERDPLNTSTFGTGQLMRDAVERGVQRMILGVGGSATNDGGMGMASAMGVRFCDSNGQELPGCGRSLEFVGDYTNVQIALPEILVICDVQNPLTGPDGAARTFAMQKGADDEMVGRLDEGLMHLAEIVAKLTGQHLAETPGAGAAGGAAFGAMAFLNARLVSGIDFILDFLDFDQKLANADLVITGEGKIDGQTAYGKLISGICRRASRMGIPVLAVCGKLDARPSELDAIGLHGAFSIADRPMGHAESIERTPSLLKDFGYNISRVLHGTSL